jgi:hypothetical protein
LHVRLGLKPIAKIAALAQRHGLSRGEMTNLLVEGNSRKKLASIREALWKANEDRKQVIGQRPEALTPPAASGGAGGDS